MKPFACRFTLLVCSTAAFLGVAVANHQSLSPSTTVAQAGPALRFEANRGQAASEVRYVARGSGQTLLLGDTEASLVLGSSKRRVSRAAVHWKLEGARTAQARGEQPLRTKVNYLRGSDPARWRTHIPTFAEVRCAGVYPGIDLKYYGREGRVEYDFVVSPGADPERVRLSLSGGRAALDQKGDLVLATAAGEVRQHKPVCYQEAGATRVPVEGSFVLASDSRVDSYEVSFKLGNYDPSLPLVIDPVLSYSTFVGGNSGETARSVAVDAAGAAYVAGATVSADFPATAGSFDTSINGGNDAYVAKFSPDGLSLEWATFLGGSFDDTALGIAVNGTSAFVMGMTSSNDFPTTAGAFDRTANGKADIFVAKLSEDGSGLEYGTYYGGSGDEGFNDTFFVQVGGIAVGTEEIATITGVTNSTNLPTASPLQGTFGGGASDAFVACFSGNGANLVYGTYLGGSAPEDVFGGGVALDAEGLIYVCGETQSANFPVTVSAFHPALLGTFDGYVAKIDRSAGAAGLVYSTFFGGTGNDGAEGVAVDDQRMIYLVGGTGSSQGEAFPLKGAFQPTFGGGGDGYLAKLDPSKIGAASQVYGSYLGGSGSNETATSVAVDNQRAAYVSGFTSSDTDFPTLNPIQAAFGGGNGDAFLTKVAANGATMVYSTYLGGNDDDAIFTRGGLAVDKNRNAYVVNYTKSANYPLQTPFQGTLKGGQDGFLTKVCDPGTPPLAPDLAAANGTSSSSIQVTWSDHSNNETAFLIERRTPGGVFGARGQVGANSQLFLDNNLTPDTTFEYRVRAVNGCGFSAFTGVASGTTLPLPPAAPSGLTASPTAAPDGQTQLQLGWTDNANNETGFKIERKTGADPFAQINQAAANATGFLDVGLVPNTTFVYRVRAFNTGGNSAFSPNATGKTLPLPPTAPSGLAVSVPAIPDGRTKLRLNWTDNSNNETGFKVERRTGGGAFAEVRTTAANVVTILDDNLAPNTTFDYQVSAINTGGSSASSNIASGTTLKAIGGTLEAPISVNFGSAKKGKEKRVGITLKNIHASEILHVDPVTTTGKFTIVEGGEPADLKPGQEVLVTVAFKSKKKGVNKGTMTLTSSDPKRTKVTIPLKAKVK